MNHQITKLCVGFPDAPCNVEFKTWRDSCVRCYVCRKREHSNTVKRSWQRKKEQGWKPLAEKDRAENRTKLIFCIGLPWKECETMFESKIEEECRCTKCEKEYQKVVQRDVKRLSKIKKRIKREGVKFNQDENFEAVIYY